MFHKIVNPLSGRKVSIYGKIGRKVLQKYTQQLGGHMGPCGINTESGRCKKSLVGNISCEVSPSGCCRKKKQRTVPRNPVQQVAPAPLEYPLAVIEGAKDAGVSNAEFQAYLDVIANAKSPFNFPELPPLN